MSKQIRTSATIVKLLGSEGFSDFTKNEVDRYWKQRSGLTKRQKNQIVKLKKELSGIMKNLSKADCLVVGKFIGLKQKISFDVGLKIGLATFAQTVDKEIIIPTEKDLDSL